jgi:DNA-binding NarL/FixJ family response regulator
MENRVEYETRKRQESLFQSPTFANVLLKSCCRCGGEFRADSNERVCPNCRQPQQVPSKTMNRHLTLREKQIVGLVSQAKLNKEIAYQLHLSEGTIKEYLNRIFRKLELRNRTELAVWSLSHPAECRVPQAPVDPYLRVQF